MARTHDPVLAARRRDQILQAAAACFVRRGIHATSIRDILEEAKLSAGALYRYFDSKEAVIAGLAAREQADVEALVSFLDSAASPGAALLETACLIVRDSDAASARLNLEIAAEAVRNPAVEALFVPMERRLHQAIRDAVRRSRAQGEIAPAATDDDATIAEAVISAYEGVLGRMASGDPAATASPEAVCRALLQRFFVSA